MTTVVQPIDALARESVRLILDCMAGKQAKNERVMLDVSLRQGETTLPV